MAKFGRQSKARLAQCDYRLQLLFQTVVKGWDCKILTGHRDEKTQAKMVDEGKSKVRWPNGKHNSKPSRAVDVAPWPIPDWSDRKHFDAFAGFVLGVAHAQNLAVRWGGDWDSDRDLDDQKFNDLIHFEIAV